MAFQTFNQGAVQSAYIGYKRYGPLDFSADDKLFLYWANAGQLLPSNKLMAQFLEFAVAVRIHDVYLPSAAEVGVGTNFIIYNSGAASIAIYDNTIPTRPVFMGVILVGQCMYFVLEDNRPIYNTERYRSFNFASGTSYSNVAALAGYGLAVQLPVNRLMTNVIVSSLDEDDYEIQLADRSKFFIWNAGSGAFKLLPETAVQGWYCSLLNLGSGQITIQPQTGLIDGAPSKLISLKQSLTIVSNGIDYYTLGYGQQTSNITIPLSIANGGTGASTQNIALKNLMPPSPQTGNITFYNGTDWVNLPNPSAGINTLQSDPSGNTTWNLLPAVPPAPINNGSFIVSQTSGWVASAAPPTMGSMLVWNGTAWTYLAPGADGDNLKLVGGMPAWVTP